MAREIIMHCNYCEQGQTIEEMCEKAVEWGFDGIEFRRQRYDQNWKLIEEDPWIYLDTIAKGAKKSGLRRVLFGGPGVDLMASDENKRKAEIEKAINFYKRASKIFELTVCNAMTGPLINPDKKVPHSDYSKHGSFIANDDHWEWAVEGFKPLGKLAEELKFRFAFETHMCYLHDMPLVTKKLVDMIDSPAVGVNLDYGNAVYMPENPSLKDTITQIAGKIYYVHLKNSSALSDGSRIATGLAEGAINHREYLKLLKEIGYAGLISIEAPRPGDREWFAREDLAYIKTVIKDLKW